MALESKIGIGLLLVAASAIYAVNHFHRFNHEQGIHSQEFKQTSTTNVLSASINDHYNRQGIGVERIAHAFQQQENNVQVQAVGRVQAILSDDNKGSRHQRFIVQLSNAQTVLIAHNIDLAPRIPHLKKGDQVEFFGEYEYNPQGGVIHWTHHDPQDRHIGGWLKHNGQRYQ